MFILYRVTRSKGLSCFMQFAKECKYFRVIILFFWPFVTKNRRSCSQDWIILFFSIFLFTYLIPYSVFCFMFFLLQKDFVNCRYFANLKILKSNVNMKATRFESRRSIILIRVANLLKRVYQALKNIIIIASINYFNINAIQNLKRDNFAICHFWLKWHKSFSELPSYPAVPFSGFRVENGTFSYWKMPFFNFLIFGNSWF